MVNISFNSQFELLNFDRKKLILDPVYSNGIHALHRFDIRNTTSHPITIKLRSNLGTQIAWQLENENLQDLPSLLSSASSSSSSLNTNTENRAPPHQFNQLFNQLGHIDQVSIKPHQTQKVILAFLPEKRSEKTAIEGDETVFVERQDGGESYDFFEVNGLLFFFGYKSDAPMFDVISRSNSGNYTLNKTPSQSIQARNL